MKDDLVSRKDLDEAFTNLRWGSDGKRLTHLGDRPHWLLHGNEIELMIKKIPSVPAVPLEPLCQWLAGYAEPPNYALKAVFEGYKIQPNLQIVSVNYYAEAWEFHFRGLLKSGLMDTEE